MLANPEYFQWIVKLQIVSHIPFQNYLSYLKYLFQPEFEQLFVFPLGLEMLSILSDPAVLSRLVKETETSRSTLTTQINASWLAS
jgi:SOH1